MVQYHAYRTKEWNDFKRSNRKDLADWYRKIRKENPAMARLFYKRYKECERKLENLIIHGS